MVDDFSLSLAEIAERVGADGVQGFTSTDSPTVSGIASLQGAGPDQLSFVSESQYLNLARESQARAIICRPEWADQLNHLLIFHRDPYLAYAKASALFFHASAPGFIDPTATIAYDAKIGENATIGAHTVIGKGGNLGMGCEVGANSVIGKQVTIGKNTKIHANVSIYDGVTIGENCVIHSGAVIGADGFGFAPDGEKWVKIHQLGSVRIGDNVEIGANSCIDRGALDDTCIESGVKIDDLVMIAHNVRIGENSALAGQVGIAGSTEVGKNCILAGNVGLVGHIKLADNVVVTGKTMITRSIEKSGSYSSGTAFSSTQQWRKNAVHFNNLGRYVARLKKLEKRK